MKKQFFALFIVLTLLCGFVACTAQRKTPSDAATSETTPPSKSQMSSTPSTSATQTPTTPVPSSTTGSTSAESTTTRRPSTALPTSILPVTPSADLMQGISAKKQAVSKPNEAFLNAAADFSVSLFQQTASVTKNSLTSPLSVLFALGMVSNGAQGQTQRDMLRVLAGGASQDSLNQSLGYLRQNLPNSDGAKLKLANAIWFRDDAQRLRVNQEFLQTNANYFGAAARKAPFDSTTLDEINGWVKKETHGMVPSILSKISDDALLYLLNAVAFEAKWMTPYSDYNVEKGSFTAASGARQTVEFMSSKEWRYLDDGKATGFIKAYQNGYSFAALLPNKNILMQDYLSSLRGENLRKVLQNTQSANVICSLPKFSFSDSQKLNEALIGLGMKSAFTPTGEFTRMGSATNGPLFIEQVLHKTFIQVNERGTTAGAVTGIAVPGSMPPQLIKTVQLNRPFVFAIVEDQSLLPIFIGVVNSIA